MTLLAATCLRSAAWPFLQTLCSHHFAFLFDLRERSGNFARLLAPVESLRPYEQANNLAEGLGVGKLLTLRYKDLGIAAVPFRDLREADFFLYEVTELRSQEPEHFGRWVPLLFLFGEPENKAIRWLRRCKSTNSLAKVANAMDMNEATFKARYEVRWTRVAEMFQRPWWDSHELKWILIEPAELGTET